MLRHSPNSLAGQAWVTGWIGILMACAPPPEIRWMSPPQELNRALHPATERWGALVVEPGVVEFDTGIRPWSGYWFPADRFEIDSVLKKYDQATKRNALDWEIRSRSQNQSPFLPWEGRCDAWAFASLQIPPPERSVRIGGQVFEPWEQKALWIYAFEKVDPQARLILGSRNEGLGDSPYEDLIPMELHKTVDQILRKEKRPLILDRDPKPPVWNTPIWGGRWEVSVPLEGDRDWWRVSLDLYGVLPLDLLQDPTPRRTLVLHYEYRLRVVRGPNGQFEVVDSEWVGNSKWDHPDFVTLPLPGSWQASGYYGSENPELKTDWLEQYFK